METVLANRLLDILIDNAARILHAGYGLNHAGSTLFEVIQLLRQESSVVPYFLSKIEVTLEASDPGELKPGMVPRELIELAAHEFRWEILTVMAQQRVLRHFCGDAKLAIGDVAHGIQEALLEDWPDREFYSFYTDK
jgi:hypothetical protein